MKRLFLAIALMIISMPFNGIAQEWGEVSESEWATMAPKDYPEANAIILFDKGMMKVGLDNVYFSRHVRIKILNRAGIAEIGNIEIAYSEGDKLSKLEAQTIKPSGEKLKVDKKDIFIKTVGDYRIKTFTFPAMEEGCIVEYSYEKKNSQLIMLDPWFFQSDSYTLLSEFTLILDFGFTYSTATINMPGTSQKPTEKNIENMHVANGLFPKAYTWKMVNLPPIKDEPYMNFKNGYMAALYCQLVSYGFGSETYQFSKNWPTWGEVFQGSIELYVGKKSPVKLLADSLTAGLTAKKEKALAIYNFVSNEIATKGSGASLAYGNDNISQMIANKWGFGSEKNILLDQMLKATEIESYPVLIGTRDESVFMPQLLQLYQFNHIICSCIIDSVQYYLDASGKFCPFGVLPPKSLVTGGLFIAKKDPDIFKINPSLPKSIRKEKTAIHISEDNNTICTTTVKMTGYLALECNERYDKTEPEKFFKDSFLDKLGAEYMIDTAMFYRYGVESLKVELVYSLSNYARIFDSNLSVRPIHFDFRSNPFLSEKRFFPVDFEYPFIYQFSTELYMDDSVVSFAVPDPLSISIDGAGYSRNCMYDGEKYIFSGRLAIEKPTFPPKIYNQVRDMFSQMASSAEDAIIITRHIK